MTVAQSNSLRLTKNLQWKYLRRRPWSRETKWIWNCTSIVHKLSLVEMQLREKYKENFDVSSEAASSSNSRRRAFAWNVEILLIFFRYLHPYQRKFVHIIDTTYTDTDSSRLYHINCSPSFVHTGIPTLQLCSNPSGLLRPLNAR
jgi:hypothetical protein